MKVKVFCSLFVLLFLTFPVFAGFVHYVPREYQDISNIWNFTVTKEELYNPFKNVSYELTARDGILNASLPIEIPEHYYLERIRVAVVNSSWNGNLAVITNNGTYTLECFTEELIKSGVRERACNYVYYKRKELYELKIDKNVTLRIIGKVENSNKVNLTIFFIPKDFAESKIVTPTSYGDIKLKAELRRVFGYFTLGKIDMYTGEKVLFLYSSCPFSVNGERAYKVEVHAGEKKKALYFHDFPPNNLPLRDGLSVDGRCLVKFVYFTPGITFVNREIFKIKPTSLDLALPLRSWDEVDYFIELYKNRSSVDLLSFYFPSDEKGAYIYGGRVWIKEDKVCIKVNHPEFGETEKCSQLSGWTGEHYVKLLVSLERSENGKRFLTAYQYITPYESNIKNKLLSVEVDLPIAIKRLTDGAFILGARFEAKRSSEYYAAPVSFKLVKEIKMLKFAVVLLGIYSLFLTLFILRWRR